MDINELKEEAQKLAQLLEENEQGYSSWWSILDKRINNINLLYYGFVPSHIKSQN